MDPEFDDDPVLPEKGTALVEFNADDCAPSQAVRRLLDEDPGEVEVTRVDVHRWPELAGEHDVRTLPTVMLVQDGETVATFTGQIDVDELRPVLDDPDG